MCLRKEQVKKGRGNRSNQRGSRLVKGNHVEGKAMCQSTVLRTHIQKRCNVCHHPMRRFATMSVLISPLGRMCDALSGSIYKPGMEQ